MRYLSKAKRFEAVQAYVLYFFFYSVLDGCMSLSGGRRLSLGVHQPGRAAGPLLPGVRSGRPGVPAVLLQTHGQAGAVLDPLGETGAGVPGLHDHGHRHRAGHQLHSGGPHRSLAWQTYLDYDINFEGRIALSPSIRFGLGGLLFLYVLQPLFQRLVGSLSSRVRLAASGAVVVLLAAECVLLLFR